MKITDVKVYLAKEWRTFLFVVIETDEGITGLGEAGITGRELAVQGAIEHFKPLLIGQDPFRSEYIWQLLFRGGFFPAQRLCHLVIDQFMLQVVGQRPVQHHGDGHGIRDFPFFRFQSQQRLV